MVVIATREQEIIADNMVHKMSDKAGQLCINIFYLLGPVLWLARYVRWKTVTNTGQWALI